MGGYAPVRQRNDASAAMPPVDPNLPIIPSLMDRLTDPESGGTRGWAGYTADRMIRAVRRDLEDLLNTRLSAVDLPPEYVELRQSIFAYGLPDLTSLRVTTTNEREDLARLLEVIIGLFEPRLKDIHATLMESQDEKQRHLRFRVDARVSMDPAPEVAFDTLLELTTGHYSV